MNLLDNQLYAFQLAMDKYHKYWYYHKLGLIVAFMIVSMQSLSFYCLLTQNYNSNVSIIYSSIIFMFAYLLTDFINGLIHMYMDNNTNYKSIFGPFIAAFHLHHKQPIYKKRNPFLVYYMESGSKFWLIAYLILLLFLQSNHYLSFYTDLFLVAIGILSSFAEVSHYWCHNSTKNNYIIHVLQKSHILLSKQHHKKHHIQDNQNYAFLNGLSDPLINLIAQYLCKGYKQYSDQHVLAYKSHTTNDTLRRK